MEKVSRLATALWLVISLALFCFIPIIAYLEFRFYKGKEPFFSPPVAPVLSALRIRSDSYGKGYFGASRNGGRLHKGIDLLSPVGEPVLASKSGRVLFSGEDPGYGNYVELGHPDGLTSRYAHLLSLKVKQGEWVTQNQIIAYSGKTGNARNPHMLAHLHFEIRYKNEPLNPSMGLLEPSVSIS